MSQRQAKKLRQLFRRALQTEVEKRADEQAVLMKEQLDEFKEKLGDVLKPAPKLIPDFIWVTLQKVFLNI